MEIKFDLLGIKGLWKMEIQGDTQSGEIDLTFRNTMDAAAFVASTDTADDVRWTFPDTITHWSLPVTITIANYTRYFKPLS